VESYLIFFGIGLMIVEVTGTSCQDAVPISRILPDVNVKLDNSELIKLPTTFLVLTASGKLEFHSIHCKLADCELPTDLNPNKGELNASAALVSPEQMSIDSSTSKRVSGTTLDRPKLNYYY